MHAPTANAVTPKLVIQGAPSKRDNRCQGGSQLSTSFATTLNQLHFNSKRSVQVKEHLNLGGAGNYLFWR